MYRRPACTPPDQQKLGLTAAVRAAAALCFATDVRHVVTVIASAVFVIVLVVVVIALRVTVDAVDSTVVTVLVPVIVGVIIVTSLVTVAVWRTVPTVKMSDHVRIEPRLPKRSDVNAWAMAPTIVLDTSPMSFFSISRVNRKGVPRRKQRSDDGLS